MMKAQQALAYAHPCLEAEETSHPRFRRAGLVGVHQVSVILTLNIGLE